MAFGNLAFIASRVHPVNRRQALPKRNIGTFVLFLNVVVQLHGMRAYEQKVFPIYATAAEICDRTGVAFGWGASIFQRLYPFFSATLFLSIAFFIAGLIFRTRYHLLSLIFLSSQLLLLVGLAIALIRYRKINRILTEVESVMQSGRLVCVAASLREVHSPLNSQAIPRIFSR